MSCFVLCVIDILNIGKDDVVLKEVKWFVDLDSV